MYVFICANPGEQAGRGSRCGQRDGRLRHRRLTHSKEQLPFHHTRGQSFTASQSRPARCTVQTQACSSHLRIIILQNHPGPKQRKTHSCGQSDLTEISDFRGLLKNINSSFSLLTVVLRLTDYQH